MKRPVTRTVCLLALAAVPLLAACGSGGGSSGAAAAAGGTVAYQRSVDKPAAAAAPSAGGIQVALKDSQFRPAAITAKVGQTITWKNTDAIAHTVTATRNAKFDSGTVMAGGTFSYVAKRAGTISYVCEFHPGMTGTISVQ